MRYRYAVFIKNRILFFLGFLSVLGCNYKQKQDFLAPDKNDINAIVKNIIVQDSISEWHFPLSIDLRRVKVYIPEANDSIPPQIDFYKLSIKELINKKKYFHQACFSKNDSLYLLFQNNISNQVQVDEKLISTSRLKFTNQAEIERNNKLDQSKPHIEISIPIFSLDQKKALVVLNRFCAGCGSGSVIFLEKTKNDWKIVKQIWTWRS